MSDFRKAYAKVLAKAWSDPAYKARLLSDPKGVLKEAQVALPAGYDAADVRAVEDTKDRKHLVIPTKDDPGHVTGDGIVSCC